MKIEQILQRIVKEAASDGLITAGAAPAIKVDGTFFPISEHKLSEEEAKVIILSAMTPQQQEAFAQDQESNFALARPGLGRFRASAFVQRGKYGMVLRRIETKIPRFEDLDLPPVIEQLSMDKRGLIIFAGATGAGKSTSLAAMVGHRNRNSQGHIISIEDPIEFIHEHQGCIVTQREVGMDTESFEVGLQNALRQAPDVVVIGEIRSQETMNTALAFAETGHLCLCTLHANNANEALDRIQSFFPSDKHGQVWMDLSLTLNAIIAQQLLPRKSGKGRCPIVEVMLCTPLVANHIRKGDVHLIKEVMSHSTEEGMQTLDQSLLQCYKDGKISAEDAIRFADSSNDVRLAIKMYETDSYGVEKSLGLSEEDVDTAGQFFRR